MIRGGHGSDGSGLDEFFYPTRLSRVCKAPTHWLSIKVVGSGGWLRSGFAGFCRYNNKQIENQPNNKHQQITTTKHHHNNHKKKKKKNPQIHQYWTESAKLKVVPQQNRRGLAKIWRDLTRSGEDSLDLEPLCGGGRSGGGARRDLSSLMVKQKRKWEREREIEVRRSEGDKISTALLEIHMAVELQDFEDWEMRENQWKKMRVRWKIWNMRDERILFYFINING